MAETSQTAAEHRSVHRGDDADDASVIRLSRNEPERFETVFHRHAPQITRYVTRRLGPGPAEDIVAETFLLAFQQRESYDLGRPDARPWLYGIATNLIRRHVRDEVRLLRMLERTGVDPVTESFTERVDSRISADALSRRLAATIAGLPAKHRDVLLLLAWTELTYDQVGQALGVSAGTVRSRMNRTRAKLRRTLGGVDSTIVREELANG
jgi:RNA polymerase sigma-70 factor (ECF subfamily)